MPATHATIPAWTTRPLPKETTLFEPRKSGWLGADSAASVALNSSHLLWLWGDTLWGESAGGRRSPGWAFVHGTIALQERRPGAAPVFFARASADGETLDPNGFFQPHHNASAADAYYWMVNAASLSLASDTSSVPLLLLAQRMSTMGFLNQTGTDIVLLHPSPHLPPEEWPYTTSRIPASSCTVSFNSGVLLDESADGHVYLLGGRAAVAGGPVVHMLLARIPRDALLSLRWDSMRFWGGGHPVSGWVADVALAAPLFNGSFTEGSLGRLPARGGRTPLYYFVGLQAFEPCVELFTAPTLMGTWTRRPLYCLPPLPPNASFAYAAKSHPELRAALFGEGPSTEDTLLITYNTNAATLAPLESTTVYHPLFVLSTLNCTHEAGGSSESDNWCTSREANGGVAAIAAATGCALAVLLAGAAWLCVARRRRQQRAMELLEEARERERQAKATGVE